jgi:Fe(II)/alpha-ketoglutarate-dependent arginine beta-hydroxylase
VRLTLTPDEIARIDQMSEPFAAGYELDRSGRTLRDLELRAHDLPARLRRFLADMRHESSDAACVISSLAVDDQALGHTPAHWQSGPSPSPSSRHESVLLMCAALLGEAFGWATQQDGAIVTDVLPVRGHENAQLGSGSTAALKWHTEEAFHPLRCDYLGLLCLRNSGIATVVASIGDVQIGETDREILFQPRFMICPDSSHMMSQQGPDQPTEKERRLLRAAQDRVLRMNTSPDMVGILSGDPDAPYLCVDPAYMRPMPDDKDATNALNNLERAIDAVTQEIALAPGELCFIDNFRAVHGRAPFEARFDGTDRWLKRVNITRDLRRSRAQRVSSDSRVIF